jgi:hypothetical protein
MEADVTRAFAAEGITVRRAHHYDPELKHGFIWSQRVGMDVFAGIHPDSRLIVAEAVWQYSHHLLHGFRDHRGPILTVANWSGEWPGLVGMLNLNGCLTKMGVRFGTLWSENFADAFFQNGVREWLRAGTVSHDTSHVRDFERNRVGGAESELAKALTSKFRREKAIMGVFDEGCMGMYNALVEDDLMNALGIYKERLSQSALVAAMRDVTDAEAQGVYDWLKARGMKFLIGENEDTDLTDNQILQQCRMYVAAVRIADAFGCDTIGIQYQQGLKDMTPASDLAEGILNNADRPPVYHATTGKELYPGAPLPHFNEVDECAGIDGLLSNRIWTAMGLDPANTLHDVRYGERYEGDGLDAFVWVFEISGSAPPSHFINGYAGASSERQPPMYFPLGGGTVKGISKPGEIVWSRIFIENGELHCDIGRGTVVALPLAETERRWKATTSQWPIMHAVLHGITRDQMMARHKANHIQVAYGTSAETANKALAAKAALMHDLGIRVHLCGDVSL